MIYRNWLGIIGVACILFCLMQTHGELTIPITYYSSFLLKDTTVMLSSRNGSMQVNAVYGVGWR